MSIKYICLDIGCDFCSDDENDARSHLEQHSDHHVAEVSSTNGNVICSTFGDTGEDLDEEELADEEFMGDEEEEA
ncbi:MAG: hypothetical protein BWY68_00535 [bacterium ADurb.Bin400]|nr:MAG: hypothetical protein BWY68_00535 [bacterium ADurb.Bin400]